MDPFAFSTLAEIALALNLAYLAMEKFHYRDKVNNIADTGFQELYNEKGEIPPEIAEDTRIEDLENFSSGKSACWTNTTAREYASDIFSQEVDRKYCVTFIALTLLLVLAGTLLSAIGSDVGVADFPDKSLAASWYVIAFFYAGFVGFSTLGITWNGVFELWPEFHQLTFKYVACFAIRMFLAILTISAIALIYVISIHGLNLLLALKFLIWSLTVSTSLIGIVTCMVAIAVPISFLVRGEYMVWYAQEGVSDTLDRLRKKLSVDKERHIGDVASQVTDRDQPTDETI